MSPNKPLPGPYDLGPFQEMAAIKWGAESAGYVFLATEQTISNPSRGYDGCTLTPGPPDLRLTTIKHRPDVGGDEWAWDNVNQRVNCVGDTSGFSFLWEGDLAICQEGVTSVWYPLLSVPGTLGQWAQAGRGGVAPYIVDQLRIWTDVGLGYLMPNGELINGTVV